MVTRPPVGLQALNDSPEVEFLTIRGQQKKLCQLRHFCIEDLDPDCSSSAVDITSTGLLSPLMSGVLFLGAMFIRIDRSIESEIDTERGLTEKRQSLNVTGTRELACHPFRLHVILLVNF
jgi:hypothetical protein